VLHVHVKAQCQLLQFISACQWWSFNVLLDTLWSFQRWSSQLISWLVQNTQNKQHYSLNIHKKTEQLCKKNYWHMYKLKWIKLKPGLGAFFAFLPGNGLGINCISPSSCRPVAMLVSALRQATYQGWYRSIVRLYNITLSDYVKQTVHTYVRMYIHTYIHMYIDTLHTHFLPSIHRGTPRPCNDSSMLRHVINCRRYYYYYFYPSITAD